MSADSISIRGFAREIGKSHVWVQKLIKAGVIPRNADGTIPLQQGLTAYRNHTGSSVDSDADESVNVGMSYNKAKAAKETFTAQLRQLELKQKRGELVEKKEVELMAMNIAEKVRSKLMTVGQRVSSLCEGRTAREIEELIENEINSAMSDLRKDWFKKE